MTPYTTRSGLQIGLLYTPRPPAIYGDALTLQTALLDKRTAQPGSWVQRVMGAVWRWL